LAFAKQFPHRILWIAGNHDVGVHEESDGSFSASVSPSEFVELLNRDDFCLPFRHAFGREYIRLSRGLPRAVLFPDGLLATHGGFPQADLQKGVASMTTRREKLAWLNSSKSLQDFTWTRITPRRQGKGEFYGYRDFAAFCALTKDFFPVSRLVTGHDHPTGGACAYPEWKTHPALSLKGFGFDDDYDVPEAFNSLYQDHLVVGRCRREDIPEVIRIPVDREDLSNFFREEIEPIFSSTNLHPSRFCPRFLLKLMTRRAAANSDC
jgi:hypothetical protein